MHTDTIAAISTPPGTGGISIIRLSGGEAVAVASRMAGLDLSGWPSHSLRYKKIYEGSGQMLDEVMISIMRAPRSYTKEDVVEISCHGGPLPTQKILALAFRCGARAAEPGEFTKRAFLNGRLDLSQAEAVMDVINAQTEFSHRAAQNLLSGSLAGKIKALREEVLLLLAHIEASIDYPEHEMEAMNKKEISSHSLVLLGKIKALRETGTKGKILRDGIETVIAGRPNVGKSSLLNALLEEERAIVTETAGTTRDVLREYYDLGGILLKVADTAGIRRSDDQIEQMGVERAKEQLQKADLALLVIDSSQPLTAEDREIMALCREKKTLVILNKADLPSCPGTEKELAAIFPPDRILSLSAKHHTGLEGLQTCIQSLFFQGEIVTPGEALITGERHKRALAQAEESLQKVLEGLTLDMPEDLIAIDLTDSYRFLGEITGESLDEDIIDKIFSEFCLGK